MVARSSHSMAPPSSALTRSITSSWGSPCRLCPAAHSHDPSICSRELELDGADIRLWFWLRLVGRFLHRSEFGLLRRAGKCGELGVDPKALLVEVAEGHAPVRRP